MVVHIEALPAAGASGSWTGMSAKPPAALAGAIRGTGGFRVSTSRPVRRRELPALDVVLVLDLTRNVALTRDADLALRTGGGAVVGIGPSPVTTRYPGVSDLLEVRVSALSAYALLGVPGGALADQVVDLEELWGSAAADLIDQAAELRSWQERVELVDAVLLRRLSHALAHTQADAGLIAAHRLLVEREGDVTMRELLDLTGWSRRRLADRFRQQVGMTPKALSRLARFHHAERLLRASGPRSLASVATRCGYYDQAHLNRDFREFAGQAPVAHLRDVQVVTPDLADASGTDVQDLPGPRS